MADEGRDQPHWDAEAERLRKSGAEEAIEWVREKWGEDAKCPYCGTDQWSVADLATFLVGLEGQALPMFPVTCVNCAQTVLLSAVAMGLFPAEPRG